MGGIRAALTKAEEMDADTIWRCATTIPEVWYKGDRDSLENFSVYGFQWPEHRHYVSSALLWERRWVY